MIEQGLFLRFLGISPSLSIIFLGMNNRFNPATMRTAYNFSLNTNELILHHVGQISFS